MKQAVGFKFIIPLLTTFIFVLFAAAYLFLAPRVYLSTSRVALFRMKTENPEQGSDDARNRWIWIRDGLNLSSALVSDEVIDRFISVSTIANRYADSLPNDFARRGFFRSMARVQFTGADENNYLIEVRAPEGSLALEWNQFLLSQLKFLAVIKDQQDFGAIIDTLTQQASSGTLNPGELRIYKNIILKMKVENAIVQTQRERVFQVVSAPTLNPNPIWPKAQAIILISALFGAFLGLSIEYFRIRSRERE